MKIKECLSIETKTMFVQVGDLAVCVKTWLPYSEMEAMAIEMAERTLLFDNETGVACIGHRESMVKGYLMAKYFTDLDVENCEPEEVYDILMNSGLYEKIEGQVVEIIWRVDDIYRALCKNMISTYERENSLAYKLEKTFGFLFSGEDVTETMAKSELINEQMIDMLGVFLNHKKEQEMLNVGKQDKAKLRVGGALVNLAKK